MTQLQRQKGLLPWVVAGTYVHLREPPPLGADLIWRAMASTNWLK
jgi:hypothetical protein